jgi:DNA-3-methyladenine glycosylase
MPDAPPPDERLRFDPETLGLAEAPRAFYRRPTARVARALIGCWLVRRHAGAWYGARLVETEAYLGVVDRAAHSFDGRRTARVEPMYAEGGHLYVFLVYGMHCCANVVTRAAGTPEAVLLRAAEGPRGAPSKLLSGPGRLTAALGITTARSGLDLIGGEDLRLLRPRRRAAGPLGISPRIGIDYAGEAVSWPLRFFERGSPALSGPARLNRGA